MLMEFAIFLPVLLISVVVHEVAHAQVAFWEGDDTASQLGRITLNPMAHLDLMGSLIVPLALFLLPGDFLFGWAKPVPVNPARFRDPKWGDVRVSLAGIVANLILASLSLLLLVLILRLAGGEGSPTGGPGGGVLGVLGLAASFGLYINLILAVFNLIPLPPLDGSRVLYHLLPQEWALSYRKVGRYGLGVMMLLVFFFPGAIQLLLWPVEVLMAAADRFLELWI